MSNVVPNKIVKVVPGDLPWISRSLKNMLNKQNRLLKNYKRHGYKSDDKNRVDKSNVDFCKNMGERPINPNTSQKVYRKIINKCKAPKIPPILKNSRFIINCKAKADEFITYFSQQCKPLINDSVLPHFSYPTDKRLVSIPFTSDDIIAQIRSLNPAKSNRS